MSQTQTSSMTGDEKKVKSRRPANTAFRQQRLKAWQPILTPKTVLPLFFIIGIVFAPVGGLLLWASSRVQELVIDYTDCGTLANLTQDPQSAITDGEIPSDKYFSDFTSGDLQSGQVPRWRRYTTTVAYKQGIYSPTNASGSFLVPNTTVCQIQFTIPNDIGPGVFLYYRLTDFFQNHRRYVKSYDSDQLMGKNPSPPAASCSPLDVSNLPSATSTSSGAVATQTSLAYYPCGLVANSMFNDTILSPTVVSTGGPTTNFSMTNVGIAWPSDANLYGNTTYSLDQIKPPPYWQTRWRNGAYSSDNPPPPLGQYEEFQVWMRTAGLPTFSKLARRNDADVMKAHTYRIEVHDNFPAALFGGTKSLVISTKTAMGGKNPNLGIAYLVVGGLCIILGILFTIARLVKPRKLGDHTYLTWNNDQSSATATGVSRPGHDTA